MKKITSMMSIVSILTVATLSASIQDLDSLISQKGVQSQVNFKEKWQTTYDLANGIVLKAVAEKEEICLSVKSNTQEFCVIDGLKFKPEATLNLFDDESDLQNEGMRRALRVKNWMKNYTYNNLFDQKSTFALSYKLNELIVKKDPNSSFILFEKDLKENVGLSVSLINFFTKIIEHYKFNTIPVKKVPPQFGGIKKLPQKIVGNGEILNNPPQKMGFKGQLPQNTMIKKLPQKIVGNGEILKNPPQKMGFKNLMFKKVPQKNVEKKETHEEYLKRTELEFKKIMGNFDSMNNQMENDKKVRNEGYKSTDRFIGNIESKPVTLNFDVLQIGGSNVHAIEGNKGTPELALAKVLGNNTKSIESLEKKINTQGEVKVNGSMIQLINCFKKTRFALTYLNFNEEIKEKFKNEDVDSNKLLEENPISKLVKEEDLKKFCELFIKDIIWNLEETSRNVAFESLKGFELFDGINQIELVKSKIQSVFKPEIFMTLLNQGNPTLSGLLLQMGALYEISTDFEKMKSFYKEFIKPMIKNNNLFLSN